MPIFPDADGQCSPTAGGGGAGGHVNFCTSTIAGAQIAMQTADLQTKATAIEDHSSRRLLINSLQFT